MRFLPIFTTVVVVLAPALAANSCGAVKVVQLSVDGRTDSPAGLDNPHPTLAWQMVQTRNCSEQVCPADQQTAFEVQAAATVEDLRAGRLIWHLEKGGGSVQRVRYDGRDLGSRDTIARRVRVWDALGQPSGWTRPSTWTMGLLDQADWGDARWIDYPDRTENQPLPLFARQFDVPSRKEVADAWLYLSGVGLHHATVNGEDVSDEVLAPGYANYQLSSEYRTYDIAKLLKPGANTVGISLGNGPAYVRRSMTNPAVGRNSPYAWWESQLKGNGTLTAGAKAGSTSVQLSDTTGYTVGGTINVDTAGGGDKLESRTITAIGDTTISFTPGLKLAHSAGARVTGSGNNIAASDASAGAAVMPRLIGRLEITYRDGSSSTVVTDRSWRACLGPLVTNAWYSGSDYDARREQSGWDLPGADLGSSNGWIAAGLAPPPNLATKLVARAAEPIREQEQFVPVSVTNPAPGTWVFDFGQNMVGWPLLRLPELPAGITVKMAPAESLAANGTVDQLSLGSITRGTNLFNTYTTAGRAGGESWHPLFNYFGMQWVQVTGLPDHVKPGPEMITGIRLQADVPEAGTFTSSNARINRLHKMARYSFASNMMSVFTDCPGREKLSYPADYVMSIASIFRNFRLGAFMRTTMRHLVEGQSIADTPMAGNVALKTPVYDWGYEDQFGDEINWGDAIVLVPALLHDMYGDTSMMAAHYDQMTAFVNYIEREKADGNHIVDAALNDWLDDDGNTSGRITGTWGHFLTISAMARMANLTGHADDAARYSALAADIRTAFNSAFFDASSGRYTNTGKPGNASQAAQALALDAGLVASADRSRVMDALAALAKDYTPAGSDAGARGVHLSGGTVGLGPIIRALSVGGRDDLIFAALQRDDRPSYGYMMASTVANPVGFTTIGETWTRSDSKNHMILAQIDEWFHAALAGIHPGGGVTAVTASWEDGLVFQPKPVGDLESAAGTFWTNAGEARCEWQRKGNGEFSMTVTVPANTQAEVRVPVKAGVRASAVKAESRAKFVGEKSGYISYTVPSGTHTFKSLI